MDKCRAQIEETRTKSTPGNRALGSKEARSLNKMLGEARPDYRKDLIDIQRRKTQVDRERMNLPAYKKKRAAAPRWLDKHDAEPKAAQ